MESALIKIVCTSLCIWAMMLIWVKMTQKHQQAMSDVDECRLRSGCASCNSECNNSKAVMPEEEILP